MIVTTITFRGEELDRFGTPQPYHRYSLTASQTGATSTVSIIGITAGSPEPPYAHVTHEGDERGAIEAGIAVLRKLSGNASLREERDADSGLG